jgi:glycosyltransferase involved in cell wall biosynthesis
MENQKKKKVIYVITKSNWGGAQKYVFLLAKQAQKMNFGVLVVLGGDGILKNKLEEEKIEVISIKSMGRDINFFEDIKTFFKLIKIFLKEKPEVVHLNSSKIGGLGSLAARICFVPKIIFTIHGWAFNEKRSWLSKLIIKKIYWITIFLSTKTIAVSNQVKEQAKTIPFYQIIFGKIFVIRNSVESINFIEKVSPELTIISAGRDNKFGHPDLEVIKILEKANSQIKNTAEVGRILIESDGAKYWIQK